MDASDRVELARCRAWLAAAGVTLDLTSFSLASLIRRVVGSLQVGGPVRFVVAIPPGLPPVRADQRRTEQVLAELLGNAATYASAGSDVRVTAEEEDGESVLVSIEDSERGGGAAVRFTVPLAREEAEQALRDPPEPAQSSTAERPRR